MFKVETKWTIQITFFIRIYLYANFFDNIIGKNQLHFSGKITPVLTAVNLILTHIQCVINFIQRLSNTHFTRILESLTH